MLQRSVFGISVALALVACGETSSDSGSSVSDASVLDSAPDAVVVDAVPEAEADADADAKPVCIAPRENASTTVIHGGGTFEGKYAVFWQASGECPTSLGILFTEVPKVVDGDSTKWPLPSLVIYVSDEVGVDSNVAFELRTENETKSGSGTAELITKSYEPTGSFSITMDTVSGGGTFEPSYCPELDIFCP
jgi:hypothetical protein